MQQTETYNLNLIESSDTFSPGPLNENAQKLEAALETKADAADHAALDQRVQTLELHKFVAGTYTGNGGSGQFIKLPFTPAAVLLDIVNINNPRSALAVTGRRTSTMEIVSGGFKVYPGDTYDSYTSANTKNGTYSFIAFC